MRNLLLVASAAAMALSMPALAEKGGKGGGGGGKPATAQGHGQGHGGGGKPIQAQGGGHAMHAAKPQKVERQAFHAAKPQKAVRQALRTQGGGKPGKVWRAEAKRQDRVLRSQVEQRFGDRRLDLRRDDLRLASGAGSCPPGLARKHNGCLPPGQAKKLFGVGDRIQPAWFSGYQLPDRYRTLYSDTDDYYYRYDNDGYIYRVDTGSNLISGLIPLLGGGFGVGQPLPAGYDAYNVPLQYRDDFYDSDDSYYRYGDDAIYRVDAESGIIESIVALLSGGGLNVGQALPSGYDAYNLPVDYRDEYVDNDDYLYRYADNNIYQVDAKTQVIQAIVEMLT
jgi:hypothetical protein